MTRLTKWLVYPVLAAACALPARAQEATPAAPAAAPTASPGGTATTADKDKENKAVIEEIKRGEELVLSGRGGYAYDPAGRRDPFVDPLAKGPEDTEGTPRPEGLPGKLIGELQIQGITIYGGDPIALFLGVDGIGYFMKEGDEVWDGKLISVDFDEGRVVFQQKVQDPSSPIRFRDVVKKLNP